ncbi:MAG: hypothetical protein JO323_21880 [Acidobacteriia bacterium]|nr:hypothetical protein [Terriglobia bacterium]
MTGPAVPAGFPDAEAIEAINARASVFMQQGIRLLQSDNDAANALLHFDRALQLRRRLPTEVPVHAYSLAACWLNRAEALTCLGPVYRTLALSAYDEALALLGPLPLCEDPRFSRRLAIAHQNRALVLAAQNPPATADAVEALASAIAVLDHAEAMETPERDFLLAVAWMNLANIHASQATNASDLAAQLAAQRALALVEAKEHDDAPAAETGLKARHVLCRILARRLSDQPESETHITNVHDATDLADEGLELAREWERRGIGRLRNLASDLFQFGAKVYAQYQPHFLDEFLGEHLGSRRTASGVTGS